jgi:hypothetical protein
MQLKEHHRKYLKESGRYTGCKKVESMTKALQYCAEQDKWELGVKIFNELVPEVTRVKQEFERIAPDKAATSN